MWRLVGNGSITLDSKKRLALYKELQRILLEEQLQSPLIAVSKFQVVRKRVNNMYVAFSDFNTGLKTAWVS
jgi:ABC-type transport system substrate-binding protein